MLKKIEFCIFCLIIFFFVYGCAEANANTNNNGDTIQRNINFYERLLEFDEINELKKLIYSIDLAKLYYKTQEFNKMEERLSFAYLIAKKNINNNIYRKYFIEEILPMLFIVISKTQNNLQAIEFFNNIINDFKNQPLFIFINNHLKKHYIQQFDIKLKKLVGLNFPIINNKNFNIANTDKKYILLDFWNINDNYEINISKLKEIYEKYKNSMFEIIGLPIFNNQETIKNFIEKNAITWPQYDIQKDNINRVILLNGITDAPLFILIDKNGNVLYYNISVELLNVILGDLLEK